MPPATHRITLLSATSLASVVAVAGVQPADAAVVYTVRVRNPDESILATNSIATPLAVTDALGNATLATSTTTTAYTLVGTTATRTVSFARRTTGNQSGTTTFSVNTPTTAGSATFTATLGGTTITNTTTSRTMVVGVTPTERSAGSSIAGSFTLTGVNPNNHTQGSWSYTGGTQDNTSFTFQTIAVSAVASQTASTTVYALPGKTATQAYTIKNTGDGSKAGADNTTVNGSLLKSNLWGSASASNGSSWTGSGVTFDGTKGNPTLTDTGASSDSITSNFTYTGQSTRGSTNTATITATYTTGGTNNAGSKAVTVLTGTTVAPVNSTTPTNTTVYALPGKTGTGTFNIQNVGDGSYVGASLTGTLTTTVTGGFAGSVADKSFTLADGKAPTTPTATTLTQTLTFTGGASRTVTGTATVTAAFTNGSTLGTNASQTVTQTFQGVTVAPVAATSASSPGSTQYVLVGSGGTATGSFTVKNTGDGTLAGANLTGTVTNTLGTGFTASAPTGAISLGDSNLAGPNGTSLTQTVTYKDEGTRSGTVRVASSVATFTNGSADGKNNAAASVTTGFSAQSVAPLASVTATLNAGTVRVGTSSAVALTVQNVGDGNLAGKDNGTTLLTNLRGTVGAGTGSFSGGGGAVNLTDTTGGQSAANASSTYMFNYAPTARTNGLTESVSVSTTLQNGASNANAAGSSTTTLSGIAVGPDFDAAVAGKNASSGPIINGGTIRFGDSVGGLTLQDLLISNLSNDAASKALTDLTLTNVTITGSTEFSFSLSGFDSGNTVGFGSSSKNAVLSNLANGDGSGAIAIQFVSKAGNGAAQLRIETDEGAALGGAGAVYVYNLIWSVPEPGTIAIFGAGLLGLAISRQRRRGRAFVALTAKPEEEVRPSAR